MQDVELIQDENGIFDVSIEDGDLKGVDDFSTSYWVCLFTDARATSKQVQIPEYRRGWPGNTVSPVDNRQLGGWLWLIDQRRLIQETLNAAIDYARGSLNWFVEDGLLITNTVTGSIIPKKGIQLEIISTALTGQTETRYFPLWEATSGN